MSTSSSSEDVRAKNDALLREHAHKYPGLNDPRMRDTILRLLDQRLKLGEARVAQSETKTDDPKALVESIPKVVSQEDRLLIDKQVEHGVKALQPNEGKQATKTKHEKRRLARFEAAQRAGCTDPDELEQRRKAEREREDARIRRKIQVEREMRASEANAKAESIRRAQIAQWEPQGRTWNENRRFKRLRTFDQYICYRIAMWQAIVMECWHRGPTRFRSTEDGQTTYPPFTPFVVWVTLPPESALAARDVWSPIQPEWVKQSLADSEVLMVTPDDLVRRRQTLVRRLDDKNVKGAERRKYQQDAKDIMDLLRNIKKWNPERDGHFWLYLTALNDPWYQGENKYVSTRNSIGQLKFERLPDDIIAANGGDLRHPPPLCGQCKWQILTRDGSSNGLKHCDLVPEVSTQPKPNPEEECKGDCDNTEPCRLFFCSNECKGAHREKWHPTAWLKEHSKKHRALLEQREREMRKNALMVQSRVPFTRDQVEAAKKNGFFECNAEQEQARAFRRRRKIHQLEYVQEQQYYHTAWAVGEWFAQFE